MDYLDDINGKIDYFDIKTETDAHILAVEVNDFLPRDKSGKTRSRVIPNILHLLDHVDKHRVEANFYITTELLKDFPEVVSLICSRGHEIGVCLDFRENACYSNLIELKDEIVLITGDPFLGVMLKSNPRRYQHHFRKLAACGYGYCLTETMPYDIRPANRIFGIAFESGESIAVLTPSSHNLWGIKVEFGRPGNIRLLPLWFLRRCLHKYTSTGQPAVLNFPLWEFDPHLPRRLTGPIRNIKNYGNLSIAEFKLTRMLLEFDFAKIARIIDSNSR